MTWREASELASHIAEKPNTSERMGLGKWIGASMSNHAQLESDPAAEVFVLTPRKVNDKIPTRHDSERVNPDVVQSTIKLTTGRVITLGTSVIKLKDGRAVSLGAPPPPDKPPGHFLSKNIEKPPGQFMEPPPGNFDDGKAKPQPPPPPPPAPINPGGAKALANLGGGG